MRKIDFFNKKKLKVLSEKVGLLEETQSNLISQRAAMLQAHNKIISQNDLLVIKKKDLQEINAQQASEIYFKTRHIEKCRRIYQLISAKKRSLLSDKILLNSKNAELEEIIIQLDKQHISNIDFYTQKREELQKENERLLAIETLRKQQRKESEVTSLAVDSFESDKIQYEEMMIAERIKSKNS